MRLIICVNKSKVWVSFTFWSDLVPRGENVLIMNTRVWLLEDHLRLKRWASVNKTKLVHLTYLLVLNVEMRRVSKLRSVNSKFIWYLQKHPGFHRWVLQREKTPQICYWFRWVGGRWTWCPLLRIFPVGRWPSFRWWWIVLIGFGELKRTETTTRSQLTAVIWDERENVATTCPTYLLVHIKLFTHEENYSEKTSLTPTLST